MATQQKEYSDIDYKANGPFTLVLKAKKNGNKEIALKVIECHDHTRSKIEGMKRGYSFQKQLPCSDYIVEIYD